MAIGLGQMLIGGLIGSQIGKSGGLMQMLGNKSNQEMPEEATHTMPDGTVMPGATHEQYAQAPQQGGGFMQGINNMMGNPSQEQLARLGLGFNSMRMHPDANLAANFRSTIDKSLKEKQLTKQTNATINYLQNSVSAQYPNGRTDIVDMLQKGIISPTDAINMINKKPSALTEKFTKFDNLKKIYGSADKIPPFELQILGITQNEVNSIEEFEYYKEGLKDGEKALTYLEFLELGSPNTQITVEGQQVKEENVFWEAYNKSQVEDIGKWQVVASDTRGNIAKLEDVLQQLEDPNALLTGAFIGIMPDFIQNFLNPDSVAAREAVEGVVQRNLKAVLGGQFTEREGEKLVKRAYNPNLSQQENAKRLRLLIAQMKIAADMQDARQTYAFENGSLRGFNQPLPTMDDFWSVLSQNRIGDIVCDSATGSNQKCYEYIGGNDTEESSWKLQEKN